MIINVLYSSFKVIIILATICIIHTSGEIFKKSISINKRKYDLLGSRLPVDGVHVEYFARIPYAKPPINNLRFKHPQKMDGDPWTGVYNSTIQPNTCWQAEGGEFDKLNPAARLWLSNTSMSEDCLYLTIWSPKTIKPKLSVMVWIYGGGFLSGSSTLEVYDGSILAAKNEVVVVSLQYRLGPFGFLYLDDVLAPGNQGLMDQQMALKWVKDNIHNFNGDSDSITIFGESAGSASVSLHVLSPLSQHLFNRAIMESATAMAPWGIDTKSRAKEKSMKLAEYVQCDIHGENIEKILICLQNIDPSTMATKQFNLKSFIAKKRYDLLFDRGVKHFYTDASFFIDIYFTPIYDGFFISKSNNLLFNETNFKNNVSLLLGFNANEGMYFLFYGLNTWLNFINKKQIQDTSMLSSNNSNSSMIPNYILENLMVKETLYPNLIPLMLHEYNIPNKKFGWDKWNSIEVISAFDQLTGDQQFICPVIDYAEIIARYSKNIYLYSFQHRTDSVTFPKWAGAMHGYEIEYVFGMPFSEKFQKLYYSFTSDEKKLSELVMVMWTNFAKYGNPTPKPISYFNQYVSWPSYNMSHKLHFVFQTHQNKSVEMVQKTEKSQKCKFWNYVIPSLTSFLSNGSISSVNQMTWIKMLIVLLCYVSCF